MAHIHLISNHGSAARSSSRTDAGQNLSADAGDQTASSFAALLAAGADAVRSEQLPVEQADDKAIDAAADTATDTTAVPAELTQLSEPGGTSLPRADKTDDAAALTNQQARDLADAAAPVTSSGPAAPLTALDAARENKAGDEAETNMPALRVSDQPSVADRNPIVGAKAGPEPGAVTAQSAQLATNTDTPLPQPGPSGANAAPALQAAASPVQTGSNAPAAVPVSIDVPEPLDSNAWSNSFSQKVVLTVSRNEQLAEIRVNPPHLGPVEVKLTLSGDDNRIATVHFAAHHASVREAIESAFPRLREMFSEAGISLGDVSVGSDSSGREAADSGRGNASTEAEVNADANDHAMLPAAATQVRISGKVDTFA